MARTTRIVLAACFLLLACAAAAPSANAQHLVCVEGGSLGCDTRSGNLVEVYPAGHTVGIPDPCYTTRCF